MRHPSLCNCAFCTKRRAQYIQDLEAERDILWEALLALLDEQAEIMVECGLTTGTTLVSGVAEYLRLQSKHT